MYTDHNQARILIFCFHLFTKGRVAESCYRCSPEIDQHDFPRSDLRFKGWELSQAMESHQSGRDLYILAGVGRDSRALAVRIAGFAGSDHFSNMPLSVGSTSTSSNEGFLASIAAFNASAFPAPAPAAACHHHAAYRCRAHSDARLRPPAQAAMQLRLPSEQESNDPTRRLPVQRSATGDTTACGRKLRRDYVRQQAWPCKSAIDHSVRRRSLYHAGTLPAAHLRTHMTDDVEARRQVLQHLRGVFA
jgi:hypothetical protein